MRLWDVGQQRCVQTICPMLGDSIWALATDDGFSTVWSGGREGRVYATAVSNRQSRVVLTETHPITALTLSPATRGLWVGTTKSTVCQWIADEPSVGSPDAAQRPGAGKALSPPSSRCSRASLLSRRTRLSSSVIGRHASDVRLAPPDPPPTIAQPRAPASPQGAS